MRHHYKRSSRLKTICSVILLIIVIAGTLYIDTIDQQKAQKLAIQSEREVRALRKEQKEHEAQEAAEAEKLAYAERVAMYSDDGLLAENDGELVMSYSDIVGNGNLTSYDEGIIFTGIIVIAADVNNGIGLLKITAKSNTEKSEIISISFYDENGGVLAEHPFYLTTQLEDIYFPVLLESETSLKEIHIETANEVMINDFSMSRFDSDTKIKDIKVGTFLNENYNNYYLESNISDIVGRTILADENYVYMVTENAFTIYELQDNSKLKYVSRIYGLGSNTWKMCRLQEGNSIGIASRSDGVYFVNIEDKAHPYIASHYQTNELATDISSYGNYAVIASRYFGVEIVDITDLNNPEKVGIIWKEQEEFESCLVNDKYLYISTWANKLLEIYDISDINNPVLINTTKLDGRGYYLDICDNHLFVATGHHSSYNFSTVSDIGYGTGNGVEIYDISNPTQPQWISTIKLDGRFYGGSYDIWGVEVHDNYAYLYNTYNGIYTYDIRNAEAPIRIDKINIPILSTSELFMSYENDNYLFPYDDTKWMQAPITDIEVIDGAVLIISPVAGVYLQELSYAKPEKKSVQLVELNCTEKKLDSFIQSSKESELYSTESRVWSVETNGEYIYVACGDDGIDILDMQLNYLTSVSTAGCAMDLELHNGYLYVAEGVNGLSVYSVDGLSFQKISSIEMYDRQPVMSIVLNEEQKMILAEAGASMFSIINVASPKAPTIIKNIWDGGVKYYREISTSLSEDGSMYFKGLNGIFSLNFDENSSYIVSQISNFYQNEHCGVAAGEENIYCCYGGNLQYVRIEEAKNRAITDWDCVSVEGISLAGKVQVIDKWLFVIEEQKKLCFVFELDAKGVPTYIEQWSFEGYPDLFASYSDKEVVYMLVPIRDLGVIKIAM